MDAWIVAMVETDLDDIVDYIAQDDPAKARRSARSRATRLYPLCSIQSLAVPGGPACQIPCASGSSIEITSCSIACWTRPHRGNFASENAARQTP
jgi:hypothetical protein